MVGFYDALNGGDVDAMVAAWPSGDRDDFVLLADRLGERTAVACSPGDAANLVVCEEFVGNDFFDPAGIRATFTMQYELVDDAIAGAELIASSPESDAYRADFGAWLQVNDPELFASSYNLALDRLPFDSTADVAAIIARVAEFVAVSDDYPPRS